MKNLLGLILALLWFPSFSQKSTETVYQWSEVQNAMPDTIYNLSLAKMKLTELPAQLWKFKNLKKLYLNKNKLSALPDSFDVFTQLEVLDIGHNQFEVFPIPVAHLRNLKALIASDNRLTSLPDALGNLKKLEVLDFYNNEILNIGLGLFQLENLKKLDLSGTMYGTIFQKNLIAKLPGVKIKLDPPCTCLD
jgi:Leucine-rich repeat (LRR) protein